MSDEIDNGILVSIDGIMKRVDTEEEIAAATRRVLVNRLGPNSTWENAPACLKEAYEEVVRVVFASIKGQTP